jgi:hypothetical protein
MLHQVVIEIGPDELSSIENDVLEDRAIGIVRATGVTPQPSGGYWRTYGWSNWRGNSKLGKFTSSIHISRISSAANINGVIGSVWDIHAFNNYENTDSETASTISSTTCET